MYTLAKFCSCEVENARIRWLSNDIVLDGLI